MRKLYDSHSRRFPALIRSLSNFEFLEARTLLSVSQDASGWTVITPEAGSKVIYCSSSTGNDANSGTSPGAPVASLARAESLLTDHSGDQLLLKAGDTWSGGFVFWTLSGESAQQPMVIGSYGTGPRPTILSGTSSGFTAGTLGAPEVDYLAIMGIDFVADGRDPDYTNAPDLSSAPVGINFLAGGTDILVENCEIQDYAVNVNFQDFRGPISDVSFRRNISVGAYSNVSHAEGFYSTGVDGLTIQDNLFDADGYNLALGVYPVMYNQDCYISAANQGVVVTDNIFANAANTGLQDRPGGIVENNLFIGDPIDMMFGLVNGSHTTPGGVSGTVSGNVFFGGGNLGSMEEGIGLEVGNIAPSSNTSISNNIFTQSEAGAGPAIMLTHGISQIDPQDSVGINDLTISNNIISNWTTGIDVYAGQTAGGTGLTAFNGVSFIDNTFSDITNAAFEQWDPSYLSQETFSGNQYYNSPEWNLNAVPLGQQVLSAFGFSNPMVTVAEYDQSIGGPGTIDDFLSLARTQSQASWNTTYTAAVADQFIEAGFGLSTGLPSPGPTPTPTPTGTSSGGIGANGASTGPGSSTSTSGTSSAGSTGSNATSAISVFQALQYTEVQGLAFDNYKGLGYANNGDWAEYAQVDFGTGASYFQAYVAATHAGGAIEIHLDSPSGTLIGTLPVAVTGNWGNYTQQTASISGATGVHDVFLVFTGTTGIANIESFQFAMSLETHPAQDDFDALDWTNESGVAFDQFNGVGYTNSGDWIEYAGVDFGQGVSQVTAMIAALFDNANATMQFHLDSPTGAIIASLVIMPTGAWNNYVPQSTAVTGATGVHDLYVVFQGGSNLGNLESFQFS